MALTRWGLAAAGALLVGLLGLGIVGGTGLAVEGDEIQVGGDDDEGEPDTTVARFGRFQPDEEAVGTLPTRDDEDEDDDDLMGPEALPSFFLEGPRAQVMGCFVSMSGDGYVDVDVVDNGGNGGASGGEEVRITFHGQVRLTFDAGPFGDAEIKTGISSYEALGSTIAMAMTEDDLLLVSEVPASTGLEVPFGSFERLGLLDEGVHVITSNRIRGRDHIGVSSFGGLVEIRQGLPIE